MYNNYVLLQTLNLHFYEYSRENPFISSTIVCVIGVLTENSNKISF